MTKNRSGRADAPKFHTLAFATREAAEQVYEDLVSWGLSPDDISFFVHADPRESLERDAALDHDIDVGGAVGAGAGGLVAGLGLLVIPGFGPLLAIGPLAAALTGAITGGALGGLAGSLVGAGVSEVSAATAEKHLAAGRAIITLADSVWNEPISEIAHRSPALIGIEHA